MENHPKPVAVEIMNVIHIAIRDLAATKHIDSTDVIGALTCLLEVEKYNYMKTIQSQLDSMMGMQPTGELS